MKPQLTYRFPLSIAGNESALCIKMYSQSETGDSQVPVSCEVKLGGTVCCLMKAGTWVYLGKIKWTVK
jgi:hypothetical protein